MMQQSQLIIAIAFLQNNFLRFVPFLLIFFIILIIIATYKITQTKEKERVRNKKRLILSVVWFATCLLAWMIIGSLGSVIGVGQGGSVPVPSVPGGYSSNISPTNINYNNYYKQNNGTVSDVREFIKNTFSARIKTREVEVVAKKIKNLVKLSDGRLDSSNIDTKYASLSFVIPKNKLDDFEEEIRTFTNAKLYTQTVSSENLLNQKQNLERNQASVKETTSILSTQKQNIQSEYLKQSNTLKADITSNESQLKNINLNIQSKIEERAAAELDNTTKESEIETINSELTQLQKLRRNLTDNVQNSQSSLLKLTNEFKQQMVNFGMSIDEQKKVMEDIGKQENEFFDNIETVQGTVIISYISLIEMIFLLSPVDLSTIILIIVFIGTLKFVWISVKVWLIPEKEL